MQKKNANSYSTFKDFNNKLKNGFKITNPLALILTGGCFFYSIGQYKAKVIGY